MALAESIKKGGRYTKKEQEERRLQVQHLHFEEKKSATKIAELLKVNRNTVNEDIRFWYSQLSNSSNDMDFNEKMIKQIQKMEIQRDRFLDYLEEVGTIDDKIRLEKFISDVDNKLIQFCSRGIFNVKKKFTNKIESTEIQEDEIKEIIRHLIFLDKNLDFDYYYHEKFLKIEIIKKTKCDVKYAERVFEKMMEYGLKFYRKPFDEKELLAKGEYSFEEFNILDFALLRGYISKKELEEI